jgi:uncharacterized protein
MGFFLMRCLHHPEVDDLRQEHRARHRDWVSSGGDGLVSVLIGSALTDSAGVVQGNFGILEARSESDALEFARGDPYAREGIVRELELTGLPSTFQVHRIAEPMSPRLDLA